MPPRHSYWTIILEGKPTAFRAHTDVELLPTFKQLQSRHPDVVMKWYSRGRLWSSPEEEQAAVAAKRSERPDRRGRDWRPGGSHQDPRERFKIPRDEKRRRFADRMRRDGRDERAGEGPPRPDRGPHRKGPWQPTPQVERQHDEGGSPRPEWRGPRSGQGTRPAGRGPSSSGFDRRGPGGPRDRGRESRGPGDRGPGGERPGRRGPGGRGQTGWRPGGAPGGRDPGNRGPGDRGRGPGGHGPGGRGPGGRGPGGRGPGGRGPGGRGPGGRGPGGGQRGGGGQGR
jgi:hypothetical protein